MKDKVIISLLIFSLVLNFVILGFFIRHRVFHPRAPEPGFPLKRHLERTEQGRDLLHNVLPEHRRKIMELKRDLFKHRQEFFSQLQAEDVNYKEIEHLVDDIIHLQAMLEKEIAKSMIDISQELPYPERRKLFEKIMQQKGILHRLHKRNNIREKRFRKGARN